MYIAVTRVQAPKEHLEKIAEAFRRAAPGMQHVQGCVGFELWQNDDTLEAISRWESKAAIEAYARSPLFAQHHPGTQSGQGAGPGQVEYFESETLF